MSRIYRIVRYLIQHLVLPPEVREGDVAHQLVQLGYARAEIDEAFQWLGEQMRAAELAEPAAPSRHSRRLLVGEELVSFEPRARGLLVRLQELALLTPGEADRVIERLSAGGVSTIGVRELESAIAEVVDNGPAVLVLHRQDRLKVLN